jgi:hypothetical protein
MELNADRLALEAKIVGNGLDPDERRRLLLEPFTTIERAQIVVGSLGVASAEYRLLFIVATLAGMGTFLFFRDRIATALRGGGGVVAAGIGAVLFAAGFSLWRRRRTALKIAERALRRALIPLRPTYLELSRLRDMVAERNPTLISRIDFDALARGIVAEQ